MLVAFTFERSLGLGPFARIANSLAASLAHYFADRDYGDELQGLLLHWIVVAPECEFFFPLRKPRYKKGVAIIREKDQLISLTSTVRYEVKIDYGRIKQMTAPQIRQYLQQALLRSCALLATAGWNADCAHRLRGIQLPIALRRNVYVAG